MRRRTSPLGVRAVTPELSILALQDVARTSRDGRTVFSPTFAPFQRLAVVATQSPCRRRSTSASKPALADPLPIASWVNLIVRTAEATIKQIVSTELRAQMRPGGLLRQ